MQEESANSLTSGTHHTIQIPGAGKKFSCDNSCPQFKECGTCAQTIAVAFKVGKLKDLLEEYDIPLSHWYQFRVVLVKNNTRKQGSANEWNSFHREFFSNMVIACPLRVKVAPVNKGNVMSWCL